MIDTVQPSTRGFAWRSFRPSWPLVIAFLAYLKALVAAHQLLNDPDTYLHIAAGNWMLAQHALPSHDPFSHSMPGAHWVVHEWLAELILALTYSRLGWWGVIFLTAGCFALTLALLAHSLAARLAPIVVLPMVALSALVLLPHLLARPHMLADPLLIVWCAGVIGARDAERSPSFALLPLMTLWANLHAGYMIGVMLVAFFGGEAVLAAGGSAGRWSAARRWGGFTLLSLIAAALTPNGIDGLLLPISFMDRGVLFANMVEWRSASFDFPELWLFVILAAGVGVGVKLPLPRLALILGLGGMALLHVRYADLVAMIVPLAIAAPLSVKAGALLTPKQTSRLSDWLGALARPAQPAALAAALGGILAISVTCASAPLARDDGPTTPGAALAAAARLQLDGPVFNAEGFGGFLLFRGVKTFIDGRMEMYGDAFLLRFLEAQAGNQTALAGILERYHITWTLLEPQDGAVGALDDARGWQRVYADQFAVIHARTGGEQATAAAPRQ